MSGNSKATIMQEKVKIIEEKIQGRTREIKEKDDHIEQLNRVVSQLNVDNFNLQKKLIKAIEKIKVLNELIIFNIYYIEATTR